MLDDTFTKGTRGEFRGDFTRDTFNPLGCFSRVLMQQGRVQLDSDWNEQVSIMWYYLRTLITDLLGPHWTPMKQYETDENTAEYGFKISYDNTAQEISIGDGHYYVKGILCENTNKSFLYKDQPGYPFPDSLKYEDIINNKQEGSYLVYLDVWERHVSYVEDDYIREKALGGPDTATRAKVIWQVKIKTIAYNPDVDYQKNYHDFIVALDNARKPGTGKLKAQAKKNEKPDEPCLISPDSHYRGAENQLYRVEIHQSGGAKQATFKWSRENGSVIFPIRKIQGNEVLLEHLGKDARFSLKANDWVEFVNDDTALKQEAGELLQVKIVDHETMKVTLSGSSNIDDAAEKHPYLRRWDQNGKTVQENGTISVVETEGSDNSDWLTLENEIKIQFPPQSGNESPHIYQTGDYWLIPARTATGDVEWPGPANDPTALSPQGVEHHYAPLALITTGNNVTDLRRKFNPPKEANV
jgi:hypothetical protein